MVEIRKRLACPATPNFILFADDRIRKRQEGYHESEKIPIEDLDDETLRKIGEEWTEVLIARASSKRKAVKEGK